MDTWEKFIRAVHALLYTGGRDGGMACKSSVHAFVNAINDWHVRMGIAGPELDLPRYKAILEGCKRGKQVVPQKARILPDAEPGHLSFPYELFKQCVAYCDGRLNDQHPERLLGLRRDSVMLRILFVHMRRQDELWQMTRASLHDLGAGKGFNWVIPHMKNKQQQSSTIPIVEQTSEGIAVGSHLRVFLQVAPPERDGRLFRHTRNVWGSRDRWWEPEFAEATERDGFGKRRLVTIQAGLSSQDAREAIQRLIDVACPGADFRLYSGHSLRGGGATAALANNVPLATVQRMLEHKHIDSTLHYTRPSREQVRAGFAAVGSSVGSASSSSSSDVRSEPSRPWAPGVLFGGQ
jgi:hypothetical protein